MRFRHDDMCERAAPDDGCGCRSRLLSSESRPADDAGDELVWLREENGRLLAEAESSRNTWRKALDVTAAERDEARAEVDSLRAEVERLTNNLIASTRAHGRAGAERDSLRVTLAAVGELRLDLNADPDYKVPKRWLSDRLHHILSAADPVSLADEREPGLLPRVCTDPDCEIPTKSGRPMHGPHDFRAGGAVTDHG